MRVRKPMSPRRRAIDDLRTAIACLPRSTREAMLTGLVANDIIVGAYSTHDGICPMLAAHRAGGRTNFIGFAQAWDRFAQTTRRTRRSRRATQRELLILRSHLEASLLDDAQGTFAQAIAEHEALAARPRPAARASDHSAPPSRPGDAGAARPRPGDPDRSQELRRRPGWAWTRIFRRYDDYAHALAHLADEAQRVGERTPV